MSDASIANWLTFGLSAVTAWMAFATHRMASATKAMAELETLPCLSFVGIGFEQRMKEATAFQPERINGLRPTLQLRNPGRVRVTFDVQQLDFMLEGKKYPAREFANHIGVVHPNETSTFFHPVADTGFVIAPGMTGEINLQLMFWRIPEERETLALKVSFEISRVDGNLHVGWLYLEGPSYT